MDKMKVVWVDLRFECCGKGLCGSVPEAYDALQVRSAKAIKPAIEGNLPGFLCFEYDHPAIDQMEALRDTRLTWPALPVLMITVDHSEELAVWALRMRVWDYVVMPLSREDLCVRLAMLARVSESQQAKIGAARSWILSSGQEERLSAAENDRVGAAISFVEQNLTEKISLGEVAQLCGLGQFQFSRAFKRERGTTFREFLIRRRINRALQLFDNSSASVTDVAFATGFNDLSYFARVFRRFTGVSPSLYRRERGVREIAHFPMPDSPRNGLTEWPIAKYFHPSARKS